MYRTFTRKWWSDRACTVPGPTRRRYDGRTFKTEAEAQEACRKDNEAREGCWRTYYREDGAKVREHIPHRGPYGLATEYESY